MKTRLRAESAEKTLQALAAPVSWAFGPIHVAYAGSFASRGMGSNDHRRAPVRTSNARITPSGASTRWLSGTAEPTITRLPTIVGGEVTPYSQWYSGLCRNPA